MQIPQTIQTLTNRLCVLQWFNLCAELCQLLQEFFPTTRRQVRRVHVCKAGKLRGHRTRSYKVARLHGEVKADYPKFHSPESTSSRATAERPAVRRGFEPLPRAGGSRAVPQKLE